MSSYSGRHSGDRSDGRILKSLNGFSKFIPYIMPSRVDALNYYDDSFEVSELGHWCNTQRAAGYKGIGFLHIMIAAYVRAVALLPALNRFVCGRHIYSHNDIEVVMAVKRSMSLDAEETMIKVRFDPTDTVYDVYHKMNAAVDDVRHEETNETDDFANRLKNLPRLIIRLAIWFFGVLDYFGILPKKWINLSPFHGSMIITDLGSLGIGPVSHHIYNFGTLPLFISFGAKRSAVELNAKAMAVEKKYIDAKFTIDERIADGYTFAAAFKLIKRFVTNPSLLEVPPEKVNRDVF